MDIITLGIIACGVGAAFCSVIAGAVAHEVPGASEPHEMLNLFQITPVDAADYMH